MLEAKYSDGNLYCRFERQTLTAVEGKSFDMAAPHFLLLARGSASDTGAGYHDRMKSASARAVQLAETGAVGASKGSEFQIRKNSNFPLFLQSCHCAKLLIETKEIRNSILKNGNSALNGGKTFQIRIF